MNEELEKIVEKLNDSMLSHPMDADDEGYNHGLHRAIAIVRGSKVETAPKKELQDIYG